MINRRIEKIFAACFIFILATITAMLLVPIHPFQHPTNKADSGSAALGFVIALMRNREDVAYSLASVETHGRIEEWVNTHQSFSCPIGLLLTNDDPFETEMGNGGGGCDDSEDNCDWFYALECYCHNHLVYRIEIEEMKVKRIDSKQVILNWAEVKEYRRNLFFSCVVPLDLP